MTKAAAASPHVVVIDNYDSFTYNLVQYLETLGARCSVWLHDRCDVEQVRNAQADGLLISPGPGTPDDAGISLELIDQLKAELPILGVCLGHQALAQAFGGSIIRADRLMHGKVSHIRHDERGLFQGIPSPFAATRYHSLVVDPGCVPACLEVTAYSEWDEIMGLAHRTLPLCGVQFHPESILTEHGLTLVKNWLSAL
ncbi:MAG TPA: aminodeoxychorismate/anthranilate synthase component II [Polyangiaceae bacterium]|nr:aminodeoxychorismate/anthranilate synthase component II [Polyangiaceae bacterium]